MPDARRPRIEIGVASEYGRLRRVAMRLAAPFPSRRRQLGLLRQLDVPTLHQVARWRHQRFDAELVREQQRGFAQLLEHHDVTVDWLAPEHGLVAQHFPRDIGFAIDHVLFVARPRRSFREREIAGLRPLLERTDRVAYLDSGTIEGGDVMLHTDTVLVGTGEETDPDGIDSLRDALEGNGIDRDLVTLGFAHRGTIHLDDNLTIVGPDLAVAYPPAFDAPSRRWIDQHLEVIAVTRAEWHDLHVNVFVIAPDTVVVETDAYRLAAQLEARGVTVHAVPYREVNRLPGGFRCTTLPLRRDSSPPPTPYRS